MSALKLPNTQHLTKIPPIEILATFQTLITGVTTSIEGVQTLIAQKKAQQAQKNAFTRLLGIGGHTTEVASLIVELKELQESRKGLQQDFKEEKDRYINSKLKGPDGKVRPVSPEKRASLDAELDKDISTAVKEGRVVEIDHSKVDPKVLDPKNYDPANVDWSKVTVKTSADRNKFEGLGVIQTELTQVEASVTAKYALLAQTKALKKDPSMLIAELDGLRVKREGLTQVMTTAKEQYVTTRAGKPLAEIPSTQKTELETEFSANVVDGIQRHNMHKAKVHAMGR